MMVYFIFLLLFILAYIIADRFAHNICGESLFSAVYHAIHPNETELLIQKGKDEATEIFTEEIKSMICAGKNLNDWNTIQAILKKVRGRLGDAERT